MWYIIPILILICIILLFKNKKAGSQEDAPPYKAADINSRKKELGASAGIGLKNLSGFNISIDYLCGVYLFREKLFFESKGLSLEIPIKYFLRVFTETLSDNDFFRNYRPKFPQFSLKIPSVSKFGSEEEFIEEHRLVFEVKGNSDESEFLVFSFGMDQFQDVKRFVSLCDEYRNDASIEKDQNIK